MRVRLPRVRVTIGRLMIVVVAASLVASNLRHRAEWDRQVNRHPFASPRVGWSPTGVVVRVPFALQMAETPLAILTATWLVILLRGRGTLCRGAFWGPGTLACLTATLGVGTGVILTWAGFAARSLVARGLWAKMWENPFLSEPWAVIDSGVQATAQAVGFAVAGAWIGLRLRGGPEGGTDRLDLAGRVMGAGWLIVAFNEMILVGVAKELIRIGQ